MPSYTQYMRQMAVLDAKDDDIESWITVKGNHIPIKKGQSKEDAVKSFIEKKGGSGEKKSESKYDPEFETVRKNALANSSLYGGRYTQKSKAEAYKAYKKDTEKKAIKHHDDLDDMLESVMAYGGHKMSPEEILSSGYHGKYLQDYVNKYGEEEVKEAIKDMQSRIDHIKYDVYTDSEGGSYNSIVWKKDTEKKDKAYNDKGLYQDALNELDDQIADKEKELENIQLSITENAESGYFDIANEGMGDLEFVRGQLNELKKKREKLAGSSEKKAPNVKRVDAKKWNSPASDPWKSLYD